MKYESFADFGIPVDMSRRFISSLFSGFLYTAKITFAKLSNTKTAQYDFFLDGIVNSKATRQFVRFPSPYRYRKHMIKALTKHKRDSRENE